MTALYSAHRLRTNAEANGDVLLNFAPLDGLENGRVPRPPSLVGLAPRVNASQGFIGNLTLDAQVGPRDGEHLLNLRRAVEDQREAFSPVRLLPLRANRPEPETIPNLFKDAAFAVGENDTDALALRLYIPLAVQEASKVTRENLVRERRNRHAVVYHSVNVAEWLGHRVAAALAADELEEAA